MVPNIIPHNQTFECSKKPCCRGPTTKVGTFTDSQYTKLDWMSLYLAIIDVFLDWQSGEVSLSSSFWASIGPKNYGDHMVPIILYYSNVSSTHWFSAQPTTLHLALISRRRRSDRPSFSLISTVSIPSLTIQISLITNTHYIRLRDIIKSIVKNKIVYHLG